MHRKYFPLETERLPPLVHPMSLAERQHNAAWYANPVTSNPSGQAFSDTTTLRTPARAREKGRASATIPGCQN
jgi:hypothetical protein